MTMNLRLQVATSLLCLTGLPAGHLEAIAGIADLAFTEVLGRSTDCSVTISVLFDQDVEVSIQYGTSPRQYSQTTFSQLVVAGEPLPRVIDELQPDTRYYYRTRYRRGADTAREDFVRLRQGYHAWEWGSALSAGYGPEIRCSRG